MRVCTRRCVSLHMDAGSFTPHARRVDRHVKQSDETFQQYMRAQVDGRRRGFWSKGSTGTRECRVRFCQMSSQIPGSGQQVVEVLLERGG